MAIFRPSRSIRAKLALLIAVSVSTAVLISFAVGTYRELSRFAEAKHSEALATAQLFAANVADAVATDNRAAAQLALNAIGRVPDVRFAEIRDRSGVAFVEAGAAVALTTRGSTSENEAPSLRSMLAEGSFFVTVPVIKSGRTVGSLALLIDASELGERLKQSIVAAAISAVVAILVGLLVAARLQRAITGPLGELAETMNRVRLTSDFGERAERRSNDETGQLVDAFNDMLGQIRARDSELEEHRVGLEHKVAERTRELADARDVAESANRAKSDFLATMSHEIRTPMNGMLVMAELLAGASLPARQQRYAETIVRSGQTLLTIINDILDLSKIEAGKLELEQGRVSVPAIVDDVLGLFWERAASKGLDLAALVRTQVPAFIEADPVRLSQILSNLVNNALKFTETGHVFVTAQSLPAGPDKVELLFAVEDTGIGIAADKVDHIFGAFSQADQSTTRRYGGTGLGLSICQRLVTAMGGHIWVESEPGKGSRFAFTIEARTLEAAEPALSADGHTALVTVRGEATRKVLAEALSAAGYSVRVGPPSSRPGPTDANLVFASAERIEEIDRRLRDEATNRPTVICVAGIGNGRVDQLVKAGAADGVLMQPASSGRVREILRAIEAGTLASLLDARQGSPRPELPDFAGLSVLVADDSPVNREVVTEALARLGAGTRTAENGWQAVDAFKQGAFDIVLMDCSMPEMDGFSATRAIRAFEAERGLARTPVVALTAHVAGSAADSWQGAGMDDYLTKPFTIGSLADCLARWRRSGAAAATAAGEPMTAPVPAPEPEAVTEPEEPTQPLDPEVLGTLRAIAGGSGATVDKIFRLFQAHAPARFAALKEAVAGGDLDRIAAEAHALKSPSLNVGARRLGALCAEVEAKARAGEAIAKESAGVARIERELAAVMAAIDRERAVNQAASPGDRASVRIA
jgi:two-component system sensor histidine kinase BarA